MGSRAARLGTLREHLRHYHASTAQSSNVLALQVQRPEFDTQDSHRWHDVWHPCNSAVEEVPKE